MTVTGGNQSRTTGSPSDAAASHPAVIDRDSLNLPNLITVSRLLLAVVLFALIYVKAFWITAAVLFVVAASTDALDGYIARKYGMVTALGRILDPFVDKIIVCGAFVFLLDKKDFVDLETGQVEVWSGVNAWMVIIVISREMFVSSLRGFLEQQGKDFSANVVGKFKMVMQCVAVTASLLSLSPDVNRLWPNFHLLRDVLLWTAVAVTIYSGVAYVQRAIGLLRADESA